MSDRFVFLPVFLREGVHTLFVGSKNETSSRGATRRELDGSSAVTLAMIR
jgi:surface antigen